MSQTRIQDNGPGNMRWILPAILALVILAIIAGAYFATHRGTSKPKPTRTPVPTKVATSIPTATAPPKATSKPKPTSTPKAGPTGTPRPGPTGTPKPGPTATPHPTAKATATPHASATPNGATGGVKLGSVSYPVTQLHTAQNGADQHNPAYTYYLNPFKVVRQTLPGKLGFGPTGITIIAPPAPPAATPTPFSNGPQGLPAVKITILYQGKHYAITLDQPETQGAKGIWVISVIAVG